MNRVSILGIDPRDELTITFNKERRRAWPLLVRGIERRKKDGETGIGDTVARILSKMGGDQFKWLMDRLGIYCGCNDRQAALNARYPYDK